MRLPLVSTMRRLWVAHLDSTEATAESRGKLPAKLHLEDNVPWTLGETALFSVLPQAALQTLSDDATRIQLEPRQERVLHDSVGRVFVVASGGLKVVTNSEDGRQLLHAVVDPGGLFGDLMGSSSDLIAVEALSVTELLAVRRTTFLRVVTQYPDFALSVLQEFDGQRRRLQRRVESLVFKDVGARVVETLVEFAHEYADVCTHGMAIDIRLTQQDLADLIGASRERVNRTLSELQKRSYLRREGRVLCIPNISRLERLGRSY